MTKRLDRSWIGASLSHGTLRLEDLYERFLDFVDNHNPDAYDPEWDNVDVHDEFAAFVLWEEIAPAIEEIAPEGTYFGAHEGDGSDFGFWPVEDEYDD